jgi:cytidine deaminase
MREFGVQRIIMRNDDGELIEFSLDELLPESFGPEALGR